MQGTGAEAASALLCKISSGACHIGIFLLESFTLSADNTYDVKRAVTGALLGRGRTREVVKK